ncbi:hypothetical protein ACFVWN_12165 [Nocardiopsis flavescens]|uniref:hypothetical protein n=1 Tax=Nocardiopsis flavescens TaxID=758803 RepID=UPI0036664EA4
MDEHTATAPDPAPAGAAENGDTENTTGTPPPRPRPRRALWWLHGAVRFALALMLLYNGAIKLGLGQFGVPDVGDALIAYGEMSPMGLLSRMVGFSPLFQFLAGTAEVGAAFALVWRRTALAGALVSLAAMSFILVLNLGYDMPGKQVALVLLAMSAVVALPWAARVLRALLGSGPVPAAAVPVLFSSPRASRVSGIAAPVLGGVVLAVFGALVLASQPSRGVDDTAPAGVWAVREDTAEPAPQLSRDPRWQRVAFGGVVTAGEAAVQVRSADGSLLVGTYRHAEGVLEAEVRPLLAPGQSAAEYAASPARTLVFAFERGEDGTLVLVDGEHRMVLAPDRDATLLFDRGFHWGIRADDPFER